MIKEGMADILGKRICAVYLRARSETPMSQVVLAFDDGTSYEFYALNEMIRPIGHLRSGLNPIDLAEYMADSEEFLYAAVLEPDGEQAVEAMRGTPPGDRSYDQIRHIDRKREDYQIKACVAYKRFLLKVLTTLDPDRSQGSKPKTDLRLSIAQNMFEL